MQVAVVIPSLAQKGPVLVSKDIIHGIQSITDRVEFTVFYFDHIHEIEIDAKCINISIRKRFNFNKFDLIHSHSFRPDAFVYFNKNNIECPTVSTLHNYMDLDLKYQYNIVVSFIFSRVWRFILKSHTALVYLSNDMSKYYSKYFDNKKFKVIYNGRNMSKSEKNVDTDLEKVKEMKKNFIILGANAFLTYRKGIDQVIEFLAKYDKEKKYCLVLLGKGKALNDLKKMAGKYKVEDRVLFLGYKENVLDYLNLYDIYMMPSRSEGFSLAVIEAASNKKPIVCSDLKIFKELYTENEVCFFELDNIESLSTAIERATYNKSEYEEAIFNKYKKNFTVEAMAKNYLELYMNLNRQSVLIDI